MYCKGRQAEVLEVLSNNAVAPKKLGLLMLGAKPRVYALALRARHPLYICARDGTRAKGGARDIRGVEQQRSSPKERGAFADRLAKTPMGRPVFPHGQDV